MTSSIASRLGITADCTAKIRILALLSIAAALGAAHPAHADDDGDPIGIIRNIAPVEGSAGVLGGADARGRPVCFVREEGDTHQLDIGIGADGAFVRLDTMDTAPYAARPVEPVHVFAGRRQVENAKATDRFDVIKSYTGSVRLGRRQGGQRGFILIALGDPAPFLDVVASSRLNFLVVESKGPPAALDYVAVYAFDAGAARSILACARERLDQPVDRRPHASTLRRVRPATLW